MTKPLPGDFWVVQPVEEMESMGVSNALLEDPFGYIWMLHQVRRVHGFEERTRIFDEQFRKPDA
ncbi:MAG: hypothetical protein PHP02_02675 [Eubacteriales bacterium]|nr:hypothetical protein [Eubacteriales bacterium]